MSYAIPTERRRSETPAGVMTTHASPTLGSTANLSMWEVDDGGGLGSLHVFDSEQIWTVLEGEVSVHIGGETEVLGRGDTVVIRQDSIDSLSRTDVRLLFCGHGNAIARVPGEPAPRGTPAWIA